VQDGLWRATILVEPAGGYLLPLQLEIASDRESRLLTTVRVRALAIDEVTRSHLLAEVQDVEIRQDGSFELRLSDVLLPGAYTITGSDVTIDSIFEGTLNETGDFMCGDVIGSVVTLDMDLAGSTFAAIPWVDPPHVFPASCGGAEEAEIPRMTADQCPDLAPGLVQGFPSSGDAWEFSLHVPVDYVAERAYPLVFLWHGLPSDRADVLEVTAMPDLVDEREFILVTPESKKEGTYWPFASAADTPELALFDDLVTCVSDAYSVDPDRIHAAGYSGGGLWTGALVTQRSDVLASVAVNSGGVLVHHPEGLPPRPALIAWGGPDDTAFDQHFDKLAETLIDQYLQDGRFVVACDHGQGHHWPMPALTDAAVTFLLDHPRGVDPEPYADALPASFPAWCAIAAPQQ